MLGALWTIMELALLPGAGQSRVEVEPATFEKSGIGQAFAHLQHYADNILAQGLPAPLDGLAMHRMKPILKALSTCAKKGAMPQVLNSALASLPRPDRKSIVESVAHVAEVTHQHTASDFDGGAAGSVSQYFVHSLRPDNSTICVALLYGGAEFEVIEVAEPEGQEAEQLRHYDCRCRTVSYACDCAEEREKCNCQASICDQCPKRACKRCHKGVCDTCTERVPFVERTPHARHHQVTPAQLRHVVLETVYRAAQGAKKLRPPQ